MAIERPPTAPSEGAIAGPMTPATASTPPSQQPSLLPDHPTTSVGTLPVTPPRSPRLRSCSKTSLDTTGSRRSHQEYLDILQPPSSEQFERLAKVQEEREKEHKRRDRCLREQAANLAQKSMEAKQDFAEAKHQEQQKQQQQQQEQHHQHHHHHPHLSGLLSHIRSHSGSEPAAAGENGAASDDEHTSIRAKAATLIQRNYRGYRTRREMKGLAIDANTRWTHAIKDAQWKELNRPRPREESGLSPGNAGVDDDVTSDGTHPRSSMSAARQNWKKATAIVMKAGGDEDSSDSDEDEDDDEDLDHADGGEHHTTAEDEEKTAARRAKTQMKQKRRKQARMMGLQYFLEMVDLKHRYGSNLRQYHEEWKRSDTNENFFYWLDYGGGKNVELSSCPRDRLEREQVRYLSREERQKYLVKVDSEGRLCWAKNGVRIDTTEQWKDSINGIVPIDDDTPAYAPAIEAHSQSQHNAPPRHGLHPEDHSESDTDDESDASESELEAARAAKYASPSFDDVKGFKKVKHVSAATIFNKLLRKSVRKNTWIFVADTSFRLYVGIKASGSFQHSSFLQGSRISAAGLIKIKNGRLASLSPLSGHYRPPAANFRAFVHSLKDEGVDMSHVSISKSYAVLVGLEAYIKTRQKGKEALRRLTHHKEKILDPERARQREEEERDKSESAALERKVLEKEEELREENRAAVKVMQKLGIRPREPHVQGEEEGDELEYGPDQSSPRE